MFKKRFALMMSILLVLGVLSACGNNDSKKSSSSKDSDGTYSGTINAAGSTALQPLADEAANSFMTNNPNVSVTVQGGGSGTGINQVASGAVQIGNSDVPSKDKIEDSSLADKLQDNKVAGIAFALVVNKDVNVDNLTIKQIQEIFSGKIKNWKELGGIDEKINVVNRPASSGTRATFEKTIMKDAKVNDSIGTSQDSNGAVEKAIHTTPGSISYLAMSYMIGDKQDALKTIKIDGAEPTIDNISNKSYPFWSYEYMVTNGKPEGAVKGFIDYVKGEEFASTVEKMGYIPMSKLQE